VYGRSWNIENKKAQFIKDELLKWGGKEENPTNPYEVWRIKLKGSTFTYYTSGKLYSTHSEEISDIWNRIDSILRDKLRETKKKYLLGFDETGKGEIIGPMVLVGVLISKEKLNEINAEIRTPDTKKAHTHSYWEKILTYLESMQGEDFKYLFDLIQPREIDRFNINELMDLSYEKLVKEFIRDFPLEDIRIVVDDYRIGKGFQRFLDNLKEKGVEEEIVPNSEEKFLEVKLASLIAKGIREKILENISKTYGINEKVMKGNLSNSEVVQFLKTKAHKDLWFIRRSFGTKKKKETASFISLMTEENKILCPFCKKELSTAIFENNRFWCPYCKVEIKDLELALKYAYGKIYVQEEEKVLMLLESTHFFDGFNFLVSENMFKKLLPYKEIGRILLTLKNKIDNYITLNFDGNVITLSLCRNV